MTDKRNLDREGLEVYLLYFLLASQRYLFFFGVLMMILAAYAVRISLLMGSIAILFAVVLILIATSFRFASMIAKAGAWIGAFGKSD